MRAIYSHGDQRISVVPMSRDGSAVVVDSTPAPTCSIIDLREAEGAPGRVVLDAGSWKPYMDVLFPLVDLVICSRQFFEPLSGHDDCGLAGSALLERGASALILTLGQAGCVFMDGSRTLHQAGFKVEALDTTGAGDVFSGAVLHALAELMAWPELLRFACAAAAHKCRANGNRDALPSLVDMGSSSG